MKMISVSREWVFRRVGPLLQSLPRRRPAPFYQTHTHGGDGDDGDSTGDGGDGVLLYQTHMVHRWEQ